MNWTNGTDIVKDFYKLSNSTNSGLFCSDLVNEKPTIEVDVEDSCSEYGQPNEDQIYEQLVAVKGPIADSIAVFPVRERPKSDAILRQNRKDFDEYYKNFYEPEKLAEIKPRKKTVRERNVLLARFFREEQEEKERKKLLLNANTSQSTSQDDVNEYNLNKSKRKPRKKKVIDETFMNEVCEKLNQAYNQPINSHSNSYYQPMMQLTESDNFPAINSENFPTLS